MSHPSRGPRGAFGNSSQPNRPIMSIEAAMEEERREVEALIAARSAAPRPLSALSNVRSSSPFTPRSPVRSMLDIGRFSSLRSLRLYDRLRLTSFSSRRNTEDHHAGAGQKYARYGQPSPIGHLDETGLQYSVLSGFDLEPARSCLQFLPPSTYVRRFKCTCRFWAPIRPRPRSHGAISIR